MAKGQTRRRRQRGGTTSKDYIFYHVYCNKYTMPVLSDQVAKIIFSGLYEHVDSIKCFLAGDKEEIEKVGAFLKDSGKKFIIVKTGPDDKSFERFTLANIPGYITDGDRFLYLHTKGVSEKNAGSQNVYWWRTWMEYHLIKNYKKCLESLNNHDIVGVGYTTKMIGPHFSGNFWWSKGSYYKTLPTKADNTNNIGPGYLEPESFIFKGKNPRHIDLDPSKGANTDFYSAKPGIKVANSIKGGRRKTR